MSEIEVYQTGDIELVNKERAVRVNALQAEIVKSAQNMVQYAIEIGQLLIEVKASLGHGEWLPWVMENLTIKERMARRYMQLSIEMGKRYSNTDLPANIKTIEDALKVIQEPKEKPILPTKIDSSGNRYEPEGYRILEDGEEEYVDGEYSEPKEYRKYEEADFELVTVNQGSGDNWSVSLNKNSESIIKLSEAFSIISDTIRKLTRIPRRKDGDLAHRKEAAYFIMAIAKGLNILSTSVNNWIERNPSFMEGDYMPFAENMDNPIIIEKEKEKPKFETIM